MEYYLYKHLKNFLAPRSGYEAPLSDQVNSDEDVDEPRGNKGGK